jgi:CRISPR-associated protein Cmr1
MQELKFTLETVTPLFLAGAEPRQGAELRPPSFRGALRYWLRATLGGMIGDGDLAQLHCLENQVFGAADEQEGASAVRLLLHPFHHVSPQPYQRSRSPSGKDYLYWSMVASGSPERNNYQPAKQFIPAGATFELILRTRPGLQDAESKLEAAVVALWLLVQLGGIGSRSRRTAGSLYTHPQTALGLDFALNATTPQQAAEQLRQGLQTIRRTKFRTLQKRAPHVPSSFDVLHPSTAKIWVLGTWRSADEAIEAVGAKLRDFRNRREPDHQNVGRWLRGSSIPTVQRAAFGLPLVYRYSSGLSGTVQAQAGQDQIDRRASPLWLKISKTTQGKFFAVATLFNARFLPERAKLSARTQGQPPTIDPPDDYSIIENWLNQFAEKAEVSYE